MHIGIVGCGYWGSKHVRVLMSLDEVDRVTAIDRDPQRVEEMGRTFPSVETAGELIEVIDELDAVVIATPPRSHVPLARAALAAGKHCLVEKPVALSGADVEVLIDAAEATGVTLMAGHTFEYNAAVWRLRDAVQEGELGKIHHIDTERLNLGVYQPDVNVVWDLAPHDISILNYVLGASPTRVSAWAKAHAHPYLEDVATLQLEYGTVDVTASIRLSWLHPHKVRRITVAGSAKMAEYDDIDANARIRIYDKGVQLPVDGSELHQPPLTYRYGDIVVPYVDFHEPLRCEDEHFVRCCLTGRRPQSDAASARAVIAPVEAAEQSIREQRPVEVDAPTPPTPQFPHQAQLEQV